MLRSPGASTLSPEDRRALAAWAVACVEPLLPLLAAAAPGDGRAGEALAGLRRFAAGTATVGELRRLAAAAHAAAREAGSPAAVAAARAAGHAAAVAHMAVHARGAPAYAVRAAVLGQLARAEAELDRQVRLADPAATAALRRLPAPREGGGALGASIRALDRRIRGGGVTG
ncbi:MAG: putative immunity protein [Amnibacterium sp.]